MLHEQIRYTEVADEKFISIFLYSDKEIPEAEALFSHILNAQHIWISRIKGAQPAYDRFKSHNKKQFMPLHTENIRYMYEFLNTDLDVIVKYTNSEGEYFENKTLDILYHVVNHSTYHRGQVARILKQNGLEPPVTDFIFFKSHNLL